MSTETKQGSGSLWAMVWMTLLTIGVVAGAGVYLDYRLETFEKQLLSQNQQSQSEILKNREVSAEFAQQFSSTIKEMSQLLTTTVESVSQHTTALAQAIEQNEQSQSETLKASLEELSKEIRAENQRLRTTLARLGEDLGTTSTSLKSLASAQSTQANKLDKMESGMSSLTQTAASLNKTIEQSISKKTSELEGQLVALQETSSSNIADVKEQISAIQKGQRRLSENHAQTFTALNSNIKEVRSAQMEWQQDVASRKNQTAATMGGIHDNLKTLADQMEVGFAATTEQTDILRSDVAEMGQTLSARTEDLLVQLIHANKATDDAREEQSREIGAALQSFSEDTQTSVQTLYTDLKGFETTLVTLQTLMSDSLKKLDQQSEEGQLVHAVLVDLQSTLGQTREQIETMSDVAATDDSLDDKPIGMSASEPDWVSTLPTISYGEGVVFKGAN